MLIKFKENRVRRAYIGGKRIDAFKGKSVCKNSRYPEEWIASSVTAFNPDMPVENEGLSICADGMFFADKVKNKEFSILVKLLDAAERLVIQCHPTVPFAKKFFNSNFGKTECWYMLEPDLDAYVYLGFKPGITKEKWKKLFNSQDIEGMLDCLHKFNVKKGDLWFVDGGVPHAIGAGCFMIELQEPSDLMVIPERVTPSGMVLKDEKLHCGLGFDKMFDCFEYKGMTADDVKKMYYRHPETQINTLTSIVDRTLTEKFSMKRLCVNEKAVMNLNDKYAVAVVTDGEGVIVDGGTEYAIKKGDSFYMSENSGELKLKGNFEIILSLNG